MDRHQDPAALARRPHDQPTQARLRETLSALPQTICHHDASHANLFLTGDEVVAIDWEGVGWGAAGADLATLVVGTMRRGDFDAAPPRLGYAAAVGLRWPIVALAPDTPLARFVMARSAEATGGRA